MMNYLCLKKTCIVAFGICSCFLFCPKVAWALVCNQLPSGVSVDFGDFSSKSISYSVTLPASSLNKNNLQIDIADLSQTVKCNGGAGPIYKNAFQVRGGGLTLSSSRFTALGYSLYLQDGNGTSHLAPAMNVCVAPDVSCNYSYPDTSNNPIPFMGKIMLKRASGSGNLTSSSTIPAGTEIARLQTWFRYQGNWFPDLTLIFNLAADLVPPVYTCSITQYDKNVTLPAVKRSDIVSHGTGRYPGAKKEFKFNLACDALTTVSVTFDGDTLSGTGTDSVLENKFSGNDNVGIQLLHNDLTPVNMAEKMKLVDNAQAAQLLSFNAYYYYKGGAIGGGPVKANATFTFDYQ